MVVFDFLSPFQGYVAELKKKNNDHVETGEATIESDGLKEGWMDEDHDRPPALERIPLTHSLTQIINCM